MAYAFEEKDEFTTIYFEGFNDCLFLDAAGNPQALQIEGKFFYPNNNVTDDVITFKGEGNVPVILLQRNDDHGYYLETYPFGIVKDKSGLQAGFMRRIEEKKFGSLEM